MKSRILPLFCLVVLVSSSSAFAFRSEDRVIDRRIAKVEPEVIKWIGMIRDEASSHTNRHQHALEFVRSEDRSVFDIVDSPELVKLHHETEKNYLVEIVAEKTPRFLLWGGNLIVKNFLVLEVAASVPHFESIQRDSTIREPKGGGL